MSWWVVCTSVTLRIRVSYRVLTPHQGLRVCACLDGGAAAAAWWWPRHELEKGISVRGNLRVESYCVLRVVAARSTATRRGAWSESFFLHRD